MSLKQMILCSKLKNGLWKLVTISQVVTKLNVTKSRLHCIQMHTIGEGSLSEKLPCYEQIAFTIFRQCKISSFTPPTNGFTYRGTRYFSTINSLLPFLKISKNYKHWYVWLLNTYLTFVSLVCLINRPYKCNLMDCNTKLETDHQNLRLGTFPQ